MGLYRRAGSDTFWMSFTVDKVQYRESTGTNDLKLAQRIFDKVKGDIATGKWFPEQQLKDCSFAELADSFSVYAGARHQGYKQMTEGAIKRLKRYFKGYRVSQITRRVVLDFQSMMLAHRKKNGQPYANAYINRVLSVLRTMLSYAVDIGMTTQAAVDMAFAKTKLKGEIKRLRFLSIEEIERLIDCCDESFRPIVITALHTGMRRGEILSLKWKHVDLTHNLILLDKTKNGDRREIKLNATLRALMLQLPSRFAGGYVFLNPETQKPYVNIKKMFRRAITKAKIEDFRFHDLRHTFASQLIMHDVPLATIQQLLGHKSLTMTLRYAHLSSEQQVAAVEKLDGILTKKSPLKPQKPSTAS